MTRIPRLPLLAPWCRVVGDGERLLLEHAQSLVVLEGAAVRTLLPALLPLLDGTRDLDALAARLGQPARPAIAAALELLAGHGVVVEGPDAPPGRRAAARAAAAAFGLPPAAAAARLAASAVGIVGAGEARLEVARLLAAAGVGAVRRLGWRGRGGVDLAVVAPAPDELDRLPAWNRTALRRELRWLLLRPFDGRSCAVGPLAVPGQTCCYECLLLRRGASLGYPDLLRELEAAPLAAPPDPAVAAFAAALAAHVAVRWVVGADRTLAGTLYTFEPYPAPRLEEHAVLRVPRCPACSGAGRVAPPLPWHAAA
ncbi:MAG TPA: TOMM precursor leader peptide-binding protein [Gaiellaceae bacterium]|nr:TOMM precursor leader peptide-binding protein [Gaiellaceae bacterium]